MNWQKFKTQALLTGALEILENKPEALYSDTMFLTDFEGKLYDSVIYFCADSLLPEGENLTAVYLSDTPLPSGAAGRFRNLLRYSNRTAFGMLYRWAREYLETRHIFGQGFQDFIELSHTNVPLSVLSERISSLYHGLPVIIVDYASTILASCIANASSPALQTAVDQGKLDPTTLPMLASPPENEIQFNMETSFANYPGPGLGCFRTAIRSSSSIVGYLHVFADNAQAFSEQEIAYLSHIAAQLSIRIQENTFYLFSAVSRGSHLLSTVLYSSRYSTIQLQEIMRQFDYELRQYMRLVAIRPKNPGTSDIELLTIGKSMEPLFESSIYSLKDHAVIFLISYDDPNRISTELVSRWEANAKTDNVVITVSRQFTNLENVQAHLLETNMAIKTGGHFFPQRHVLFFEELRIHYALLELAEKAGGDMTLYYYEPLVALLRYDTEHSAHLTQTLYTFLRLASDPMKTCAALHIHRSTLYQRIQKIQSIIPNYKAIDVVAQIYLTLLLFQRRNSLYFEIETSPCVAGVPERDNPQE